MSTSINLLVIEDKQADFRLVVRHLEQHGLAARCHCVASIEELEAAVAQGGWDAVLSDYSVPKLDFQHTLGILQARCPGLPVILVSGSVGEERAVELLKMGVWDFVLKDNLTRLVPAIERSLRDAADRLARRTAEASLRLSEENFRTLYAAMTEGLALHELVCDASGRPVDYVLLDVNSAFKTHTGLDRASVIGRKASEVYGGESPYLETYADVAITGRSTYFETAFAPMKKTFSISVFSPAKGRFATVFADITERKRTEEALRRSEAEFRAMFEMASIGIAQADPQTGKWVRVNRKMCAITGYSADELLQKRVSEITHIEDRKKDWEAFQRVVLGAAPDYHIEKRYVRKDGTIAWVNVNMTVIRDAAGTPTHTMAAIEDISERRRAAELQARLVTAVEQAAETIVITDVEARILYANPAFEKITGYTRAEAIGQNPRILQSGKQDAEFYRQLWAVLAAGQVWHGHFNNKRKDGTLFEEEATISPVVDAAGKVINYVAVKRDVTREVALEEQNRQAVKMSAVGQLAGGVAHDFNNKLQIILGYTEVILNRLPSDNPDIADLQEIQTAARHSARLTQQLLTFSRQQAITPVVLGLTATVGVNLKMLGRLVGENIKLNFVATPDDEFVFMDPSQVDQLLANLVVNARDAIAGIGDIFIEVAHRTLGAADCQEQTDFVQPGDYVVLTVRDTGAGMTPEIQAHIFEPFFTTKGVGKGTGLGLATVYGIVKQNQGAITVQSVVGQGTSFTIYLPRIREAAPAAQRETMVPKPMGKETVLLVEDEVRVLELVQKLLTQQGYTMLAAATPEEALRLCANYQEPIHLLLTDVIMPGMSGLELAGRLQKLWPDLRVLYMSGYTADIMQKHGHLPEGVKVLQKPFTVAALAQQVRATLDAPASTS